MSAADRSKRGEEEHEFSAAASRPEDAVEEEHAETAATPREQAARRKAELIEADQDAQKPFLKGHWVTDAHALKRPDILRQERLARKAPRRLAKLARYQLESSGGVEVEPGEVVDRVTQNDIVSTVDSQTQRKRFDLTLDKYGPYHIDYSSNGTHLALVGLRGHLATMQWINGELGGEAQLRDKCTDVKCLVDSTMIAVAQRRYVYMYTKECVEMHVLPSMANVDKLEFLPRHMLLVGTSSQYSTMNYLDISTGQSLTAKPPAVVQHPIGCLRMNPGNGVVATGDVRGVIKFWSPTVADPLVQLKGHKGAIADIAFHPTGRFLLSLGTDGALKLWDCRTLRVLEQYAMNYTATTIDVSQKGIVAIGGGTAVHMWRDMFVPAAGKQRGPFLKHSLGFACVAHQVRFCPFEDVLGVGHGRGFSSLVIPGAGEANPDFFAANPHETEAHRKERVVGRLLDKLQPDTISMDLQIAGIDEARLEEYQRNLEANRKARAIREKKRRRIERQTEAPTGPTGLAAADDEVDEDLGVKVRGASKVWKSKQQVAAERKKKRWDNKETTDKVRSKQMTRHSRMVKQTRKRRMYEDSKEDAGGDDVPTRGGAGTADAPAARLLGHGKRPRDEQQLPRQPRQVNSAIARLF